MVDVCGYNGREIIRDPNKMDNNLDSLLDLEFSFMTDISMDIAPTLITLYDSVAANSQVPEDSAKDEGEEEEEEVQAQLQQDCQSRDKEEPIASAETPTTSAAVRPRGSEACAPAADDVTPVTQEKCSAEELGDTRSREGRVCEQAAGEGRIVHGPIPPANHSFLHSEGLRVPLLDGDNINSYLDRTTETQQDNGSAGCNSVSSANMESPMPSRDKVNLNGARDANHNVEDSSRMVSSDSPENMAIDVDFNSNSNNDCRPRAQSADLLSDNRRWSQRQRPASAEIASADYTDDGGPSSETVAHKHDQPHGSGSPVRQNSSRINPPILVTNAPLQHEAMSPPTSPPTSPPMSPTLKRPKAVFAIPGIPYVDRIVEEIIDTERSYVRDLGDIIQGYMRTMENNPTIHLSEEKFNTLFCNLEDIHSFNWKLLEDLEQCDEDPVRLAECFLDVEENFCIYTRYCTNYPKAVDVMTECMKDPVISGFFKEQQAQLNHGLALGAYLLKPVQRILKYHLLFQDMMKHFKGEKGQDVIALALTSMTNVAWHINDMKRKHEASVHVQEIQSQLHGWQDDLNTYGDLVLEGVMRMQGARGDRFIYLFEKALLIGKKHENTNLISIKTQIKCSNLMLIESIPKEPLGFNVIPFDNADIQYTIIAKTQEQKKQWTHEIKRLILENYESNIPTKVKELILGTRAAHHETETEKPTTSATPEPSMSRDRKERKSRKKHKRRNSEPMGKLQRGQKQVKAAVENIIIGMKRPDLSKLGSKKSSDIHDDGTEDSLDEVETTKARKNDPMTPVDKGESSLAPLAKPEDLKEKDLIGEEDVKQESGSPSSSTKKLVLSKSLGDRKESNRDSGIGSMTLSEHLKLDSEDKSSADEAKGGEGKLSKKKSGAVRKLENGFKRQEGLDDTEEEEGEVAKGSEGESPDELEALEQLSDDNHLDRDPILDIELSPRPPRRSLPTVGGAELFKLRRVDLKEYRPLNDRFSKDHDVWVPMPDKPPFMRNRSFSHIPSRPQSADIAHPRTHPHFTKMRLSRTRSDDICPHAWSELAKCHSDPNITDHKSDLGDSIESNVDKQNALGSSASTFGTVDGDLSSLSSHENLADSINIAFQQLGAKYAAKSESESGTSTPHTDMDTVKDPNAAKRKEKVSIIINDEEIIDLDKEDVALAKRDVSEETGSTKDENNALDSQNEEEEEDKEMSDAKKKVQRLARKYSRLIRQQQSTIVVTRKNSESSSESDGKQVAWAVTHSQSGTIIKRFEIDNSAGDPRSSETSTPTRSLTDSEDEKLGVSRRSLARSSKSRKSVRDFVKRFEVTNSGRQEPKVVTPVQPGIQERLRSFQHETKQPNKSPQHRSSMGFKTLGERRKELEEWVAKPRTRSRHNSEGKDSTDGASISSSVSDVGDLSFGLSSYQDSYASSLHSSGRSSPCPEARLANIHAIKEGLLESISRLASTASNTEEEVTPAMFKSIRERFEELEKAAHKPIPRTVTDPKEEMKARADADDSSRDAVEMDALETGESGENLMESERQADEADETIESVQQQEELSVPFPEVFETSSSELSMGATKSESLNTHLDAIELLSDNSTSDAKQISSSSSSDPVFPEIETLEIHSPVSSDGAAPFSLNSMTVTRTKTSSTTSQVSIEFSIDPVSQRASTVPTTLDVLALYGDLSSEEPHGAELLQSPLNRSVSSESSFKDAVSEKGVLNTPTSEEYVTAEEH
ncbi:uncharacterized protein [Diadema setosum]|uniref:uncharacterized protein n=1 Tax=Diadema setosum TaxID=31175 RepID=UPI003B3A6A6C